MPQVQAVSQTVMTEWKWEIEPTKVGPQRLHLTLSALLTVNGERTPRVIRSFEHAIEVHVTWRQNLAGFIGQNWQWLWTAILIPVVGWVVQKRRTHHTTDG